MQIVFDFNNLFMRTLSHDSIRADTKNPNWGLFHQYMLDNISAFAIDTMKRYPKINIEVVLACDWRGGTWRHEYYPPYKADRVKNPDIDWDEVHEQLDFFKGSLIKYTPWKVLEVEGCEADDIVAILVKHREIDNKNTLLYSTDCDYIQLISECTGLYRPMDQSRPSFPYMAKFGQTKIRCETPEQFTALSVLTGQGRKDNVYNILTPTDWDPWDPIKKKKARMKPYGPKKAEKVLQKTGTDFEAIEEEMAKIGCLENYMRNRVLIDFKYVPKRIENRILEHIKAMPEQGNTCDFAGMAEHNDWRRFADGAEDLDEIWVTTAPDAEAVVS